MTGKSETQMAAEQLMRAAGQDVLSSPGEPSRETRLLRANLIFEEAQETIKALGFRIMHDPNGTSECHAKVDAMSDYPFNLVEVVDGCCDLNVVVAGCLSAIGVDDEPVQREVERSNRSKLLDDGSLPPHPEVAGKFGKGPDYKPPHIAGVLGLR